ncbi:MAG TPA: M23 family metallopeptidase [Longimicrobiales bacterium]
MRTRGVLIAALALSLTSCGLPRWPTRAPLTSPYGLRTLGSKIDMHHGVDLGVAVGTPVHAMARGTVIVAGPKSGYGYAVMIDHGLGWVTLYGHLDRVDVSVGDHVRAGERVGLSGNTGLSTAPHLHFEVRRFGRSRDPVPLLGGFPLRG